MNNQKKTILITGIIILLAFPLMTYLYKSYQSKQYDFLASEKAELYIREHSPIQGNKEAKVYLVEFLDPECESCRAFYPYVKQIMADNKDKVKLVVRYTPFHKNSRFIIKVLEATRKQGKFWETLGMLFHYQPNWGNHHNPRPDLVWEYLPLVGVDVEQVRKDLNDPNTDKIIAIDVQDGKTLNVRGTPTFFINGKPLEKFSYEGLKAAVEEEIKRQEG